MGENAFDCIIECVCGRQCVCGRHCQVSDHTIDFSQ
jgi:hypothetical protein